MPMAMFSAPLTLFSRAFSPLSDIVAAGGVTRESVRTDGYVVIAEGVGRKGVSTGDRVVTATEVGSERLKANGGVEAAGIVYEGIVT